MPPKKTKSQLDGDDVQVVDQEESKLGPLTEMMPAEDKPVPDEKPAKKKRAPPKNPKSKEGKGQKRQKTDADEIGAEDNGNLTTKSTEDADCVYKTVRQSNVGDEESKEVSKPAKKKPVRNKTKVVDKGMEDMEGMDDDMKQAMIVAAMADAAEEEEKGESKEESDIYLNTKDLKEAMAGIGGDEEDV